MAPTVAIIGGGYGGINLAKTLDEGFEVVLVDPKDSFVHSVAALRGVVSAPWADRMFFEYVRLLARGRFVRDRVVQADSTGVTTRAGTRIAADFIVLASGSAYPFPAKIDVDDTAAALAKQADTREALASARRVLLVGAGPVGIEFAGEITDAWPEKEVTIADLAHDILGGEYLPELRTTLREQLAGRGVHLALGSPLAEQPPVPPGIAAPFTAVTAAGERIEADIWFRCYGVQPSSDYLIGDLAPARRADGFVDVDDRLRVAGLDHVYAIGDVTGIPESKRAAAAGRHAGIVAANITSLTSGGTADAVYEPPPAGVAIPIGATGGASQGAGSDGPVVYGAEWTSQVKGRDLMVDRFADLFSATPSGVRRP